MIRLVIIAITFIGGGLLDIPFALLLVLAFIIATFEKIENLRRT